VLTEVLMFTVLVPKLTPESICVSRRQPALVAAATILGGEDVVYNCLEYSTGTSTVLGRVPVSFQVLLALGNVLLASLPIIQQEANFDKGLQCLSGHTRKLVI